ncbi:MAG: N-acetylglucosamine-6-phosphate deacetylase [Clostridiales bacterium]|nr:N-acetylglucosamine-6-phosphate deacetylase [Roseburia sp.]MDD7636491.1 N-acetylglucosamine-6-phosphate deacetylase [Clostridiales bacterium]MDY4112177.1 N-acetylglucosamine-6-phosphate deacetylase [Roseburia sp.]
MRIINGTVFKDGRFEEETTLATDGSFFSEQSGDGEELDAKGCYIIPGLIDIHFHGCAGADFCDGTVDAIETMAQYELKHGITSIHPATMTLSEDELIKISRAAKMFYDRQQTDGSRFENEAELVGIYMEGPFVSMEKRGAQNPKYVHKPDSDMLCRLQQEAGGLYHICAVAPEVENAMEFIDAEKEDIRISVAHTTADYDTAREAFEKGAKQVTHLYNAMPPFSHRAPGVVGAACDNENVMVELICDGIHSHPSTIRTTFKMFGSERIILISDSMRAAGMSDGICTLGGQEVEVRGKLATLTADGTIAGSVTNLFECMRFVVEEVGLPLEQVVRCVSENPAKAAGIWKQYGSIENGKYADFVILDRDMNIRYIVKHGKIVSCGERDTV